MMKSLAKALDILEIFLDAKEEMGISDIARISGLNKATVSRIANYLATRNYLVQSEKRGKYFLGTQFLVFSRVIKDRIKIRDVAMPYLAKLCKLVDESIVLVIWDGKKAINIDSVQSAQSLRIIPDESGQIPLHCTGTGKIFLAQMTDKELETYFSTNEMSAYTTNTITSLKQLKTHLLTIVDEGVGYDDEEYKFGVRNVASGIKDVEGRLIAAIGVLAPSIRLTRSKMIEIAPEVKRCAMEISRELGYKE
ncbi:MAG: IclR family transcriptional regulator [Dehalococcoidales bacterium]|nr:IclR family transcriptional regulator [Dehalococcoidales bacterium]